MEFMFLGAGLSTANYDSLLIGWSALPLQPGVNFYAGGSWYCEGSDARNSIIANNSWTIADGGQYCRTDWTGDVSSDWFTMGNWTKGIPTSISQTFIPDVAPNPFPVINTAGAVCKHLDCLPNAELTVENTGILTVSD